MARRRSCTSRSPCRSADGEDSAVHVAVVGADLAERAFLDSALGHGARLREGTRVESLDELDAEAIVVTAGAWVRRLVGDVPVRPTRETLAYFRRDGGALASVGQLDPDTR